MQTTFKNLSNYIILNLVIITNAELLIIINQA